MKRSLRNVHSTIWVLLAIGLPVLIGLGALCIRQPMPEIFLPDSTSVRGAVLDTRTCGSMEVHLRGTAYNLLVEVEADDYPSTPALYLYLLEQSGQHQDTIALGPVAHQDGNLFALQGLTEQSVNLLLADAVRDTVFCNIHFDL